MLAALVAVEGDGKAVHLVLNLCEQTEQGTVYLHADGGRRKAVEQFVRAVLVVFGQSGNRDIQMQPVLDHLAHGLHLSLATVGNDQIGQGCFFLYGSLVSAEYHLFHRSIIVRSLYRLDDIFTVVLLAGLAFLKHHASCHGICSGDIRVVEAFDAHGRFRQFQAVLDFLHKAHAPLFGIELLFLLHAVGLILLYVE